MTKQRVVEIAIQAAEAHQAGHFTAEIGGTVFNLRQGGYCARFIRQCHEAALGLAPFGWAYRAGNALQMEDNLKRAGLQVLSPKPGDIVCINKDSGQYGHIAIWLGNGKIAENTSSGSRGNPKEPGTKITVLNSSIRARITGYYAVMPAAGDATRDVLVIEHATGKVLDTLKMVPGGNHVEDQGKLYVVK